MRRSVHLRPRSGYDVMAALAFFIAVAGGGAYAAAKIGAGDIKNNAVHSKHIADGQVMHADLAPNSVGSRNVIDRVLDAGAFKPGALPRPPISFQQHVNDSTGTSLQTDSGVATATNGIVVDLICYGSGGGPGTVEVGFYPAGGLTGKQVYVIGKQAQDENPPAPTRFVGDRFKLDGPGSSVYLDVMVRLNPGGKWVHYQITGEWSGDPAKGCSFGGLYTPSSN